MCTRYEKWILLFLYSVSEVSDKLRSHGLECFECKRIINSYTQRPTRTIKVVINENQEEIIQGIQLQVGGQVCPLERKNHNPVNRCYVCQQFGHIAKNCRAESKCVVCAGNHKSDFSCTAPAKCGNCEGAHPASDIKCPTYIKYHESLTKQHPEH